MADTNDSAHWSKIQETGTVLGMRILLGVYRIFGRWGFRCLLVPVMLYYYLTHRVARQASRQYLTRVQKHFARPNMPHSFWHFMQFGEALLDKFLVWMGQIERSDISFNNPALFNELDNSQSGAIIVVSHLGNTEICSAMGHQLPNVKLTILVYTQNAVKFNQLAQQFNQTAAIELLQVTDISPATAMMLADRVAEGEIIVIAGDRTPVTGDARVAQVDFLGHEAPLPQGAFMLGSLLRCPVYLMFCLKHQQGYRIYLELFAERLRIDRKHREQQLHATVQRYAQRLEHYCQLAPLQWFNFYPFWSPDRDTK